jgi:PAS domain S-box-containing protein
MTFEQPEQQTYYKIAHLASIVESSEDAIISKDLNSTVLSWNPSAERIFGYSADEMIGQSIKRLLPLDREKEEEEILSRIRRGERVEHFETVRVTKDGRPIDVSITISPIKDASGQVVGASTIVRDITERKLVEQEREASHMRERQLREEAQRANQLKDEFLATLSHELRTPLMAIHGWAQILESENLTEDMVRKAAEMISRNTRMQSKIVDDLLEMNRILMGRVRLDVLPVDLTAIIEAAIESVRPSADAKNIRLFKVLDSLAGPVRGDPTRLQQVVWNLLSNAIKFTPKGGRVEVALERINSHVEISVSDTGIGIKPDFLTKVFDRFSQAESSISRSYNGLGLGLAIVKNLVELHGGTVQAKSLGDGKGATFRVALPLPTTLHGSHGPDRVHPETPSHSKPAWDKPDLSGKRILFVDDDPDAAGLVRHILEGCGAEVRTATSGNEAIALMSSAQFDVLISDIGMPEMDGFELMKAIRTLDRDSGGKIPAVALTAFSRSEDRRNAMVAGFDTFISKPVDEQELIAVVARYATK